LAARKRTVSMTDKRTTCCNKIAPFRHLLQTLELAGCPPDNHVGKSTYLAPLSRAISLSGCGPTATNSQKRERILLKEGRVPPRLSKTHLCFRLFFCHDARWQTQPPDWLSAPRSLGEPVRLQCVSWAFACWNTVRRSKRCSARGRATAVRDTVRSVNDERFRRRGRIKACVEERRGRDGWEEPLDDNAKNFRIRDPRP